MMRVIKVGGRAQERADLAPALATAWSAKRGAMCLVHGGGDAVSALQRQLGVTPTFIDGRRVTGDADIAILRMALSGAANKRLVSALVALGVRAVGISGEDAGLIRADVADEQLGRVGVPHSIEVPLLWSLLDAGFLPVISPLGVDRASPDARTLNVNADDAAAAIAVALGADELVLVADVPGVRDADGLPFASLDLAGASALMASGIAAGGMHAKLQAASFALTHGVARVRIGDLSAVEDSTRGTLLTTTLPVHVPSFA
ncbi:MAG TPA: acetylglutamate kinase [Gemmatimonadaceae bacterium]|nr:acetylglutamate kinase [Gemmatimonadaceae bacterium]